MPPSANAGLPHPFDPLSSTEIEQAISIVTKAHGDLFFNVVSLQEPRKAVMTAWLANPASPRPPRVADVVVIAKGGAVFEGFVDLAADKITSWDKLNGLQPIVCRPRGTPHVSDRTCRC
jgi:primary-amine oxidase